MTSRADDILCGEIGAPEDERWSEAVVLTPEDRRGVAALEADHVLEVQDSATGLRVAGIDQVGVIVLPSSRRVCIRPKVGGVVLAHWLAYLGECPPVSRWLRDEASTHGAHFPALLASCFLDELEQVTRWRLRKDYAREHIESATVRGRVLAGALARGLHRLPNVPQLCRTRSLDTPHNRLLATALDRIPLLLSGAGVEGRMALLSEAWAGVGRERSDPGRAVNDCRWGCPPGYGPAVRLASVILQGYSPEVGRGAGGGAFLLSLAGVWERALRRMCHDLREPTGWAAVPDKQRTKRWHDGPGLKENDPSRWMTADAIVERGGRRWVLDAKYKREYATEGRNDRFQATTYALAFEAHRASLVYPTATGTGPNCRMLLAGGVQGRPVTIDSIELPMGVGPEACWRAFLKVGKGVG